jgi:hypothetical protein
MREKGRKIKGRKKGKVRKGRKGIEGYERWCGWEGEENVPRRHHKVSRRGGGPLNTHF